MKRTLQTILVAAAVLCGGWKPAGWVYHDGDWAFDGAAWRWVAPAAAPQWVWDAGAGRWGILGEDETAPDWREATRASCWRNDADTREMNNLSPFLSDADFRARVAWAVERGCNTVHWFLGNEGNGEMAGYCIYGTTWDWTVDAWIVAMMRARIDYARAAGLAYVPWLHADDSAAWNREAARNHERYVSDLWRLGLLSRASWVCVVLEGDEYYSVAQVEALAAVTRRYTSRPVGAHATSGKTPYAAFSDIVVYQVDPGESASWLAAEARRVAAAVAPRSLCFFELARNPDRARAEAVLANGAFAVGNW